jgi:hypothetical protein
LRDVLERVIKPRIVDPGPHVVRALARLEKTPRTFTEAVYYETSRAEPILAAFAEGPLYEWHANGRIAARVEDTQAWIDEIVSRKKAPAWSDQVRRRLAQGLLSMLRDFRILRGAANKEFAPVQRVRRPP